MNDSKKNGINFLFNKKITQIKKSKSFEKLLDNVKFQNLIS